MELIIIIDRAVMSGMSCQSRKSRTSLEIEHNAMNLEDIIQQICYLLPTL